MLNGLLPRLFALLLAGACLLAGGPAPVSAGFRETPFPGQVSFRTYSADEGLTSLGIWAIVQDRDGYVWLGTDLGLFRYDGHKFWYLGRKQGLHGDLVEMLWADPQGGVWVGSSGGLDYVENGKVHSMGPEAGLPEGSPISMCRDPRGRLWIAYGRKLMREEGPRRFRELPGAVEPCYVAWAPRHGGMMVVGRTSRVEIWGETGPQRAWEIKARLGGEPFGALEDGQGRLWVLNRDGLYFQDQGPFQAFRHPIVEAGSQRRTLAEDGRGGFWLATGAGLLHIQGSTWTQLTDREGLPTKWAATALVDREGTLWYGGGGLFRQLGLGAWFNFTPQRGLPTELVWNLHRDPGGRLWGATDKGLAFLQGERWEVVPGTGGISFLGVADLPDGSVLAGGDPGLIVRVAKGHAPTFHRILADRYKATVLHLFNDRQGRPWALDRALWRLGWRQGALVVEEALTPPKGLVISANAVFETEDGHIWIGDASDGLVEIHGGAWRTWTTRDGLLSNNLNGAVEGPDGSIYVCYRDNLGLTRLGRDASGLHLIRHFREEQGDLPTNSIFSVHRDFAGRIWLNTNLGAVVLDRGGFQAFGRTAGFSNQDMVQGSFWSDPGGQLWFGTAGGIVHFNSKAYPWNLPAPQPVFTEIRFGGKPACLDQTRVCQVSPRDNTAEASMGCLSYAQEKSFQYEVWLDGLEPDWHRELVPQIRYAALPPGPYRLRVRILWNGKAGPERSFAFRVLPHWYQTWYFRGLVFMSLGPLLWGLLAWRNRILKARNLHLETLIAARTHELAQLNAQLQEQNVSDPLTSLYNRRYLMITLPEQVARIQRVFAEPERRVPMLPDHPLVFFLMDIDHFKLVNDEHGHDGGDAVLRQLGERLKAAVRETDTVIRWGGEEFLVVARQVGAGDASWLSERLRRTVEEKLFLLEDGRELPITISVGFAPFPFGHQLPSIPWEKAILLADRCLYAAKTSGRNGWVGLDEGPAYDPQVLLATATHPDIPALLEGNILQVVHSFKAIPGDAWM